MLSLKTHSVLDYLLGGLLIALPYLQGLENFAIVRWSFFAAGIGVLIYSLFTNYPYSFYKVIPVGLHMFFDILIGLYLVAAPSFLGFRNMLTDGEYLTQFIIGIATIGIVADTKFRRTPSHTSMPKQRAAHH